MFAGTVYFYNNTEELIKEIDVEEYEDLSEDQFHQLIRELGASRVTLTAFYHNHHKGTETLLYQTDKNQT